MKRLCSKNFTTSKKTKEDYRRWKDHPWSWIGMIHIVKIAILPKAIYRFNSIPFKIPMQFFTETEKKILNSILKHKNPRGAKTILNNTRTAEGITIPGILESNNKNSKVVGEKNKVTLVNGIESQTWL